MTPDEIPRLALDSPRWRELHGGIPSPAEAPRLLREIEQTGSFGGAWMCLWEGPLQMGHVSDAAYAILPHVVALAAKQDPRTQLRLWFHVALLVSEFDYPSVGVRLPAIPADLEPGFRAAL